jgi:hypothetical protein
MAAINSSEVIERFEGSTELRLPATVAAAVVGVLTPKPFVFVGIVP